MKTARLLLLSSLAIGATAVAFAPAPKTLADYVKTLQDAKFLNWTMTSTKIGDASQNFSITLEKPNKAKLDTPERLIIADGETITVYVKSLKKYYTKPQTDADLKSFFQTDELRAAYAFFDAKALSSFPSKSAGTVKRKGKSLDTVQLTYDAVGGKTLSLNLDPETSFPAQSTLDVAKKPNLTRIFDTTGFSLSGTESFAFKAPNNAEKVDEADLIANRWYTYSEALALAKTTGKKVYIHFTADWCTWCRKIEAEVYTTAQFKEAVKDAILCQVDIDYEKDLAAKYEVSGIPDLRVIDANEKVLGKLVGYQPADPFVEQLKKFL